MGNHKDYSRYSDIDLIRHNPMKWLTVLLAVINYVVFKVDRFNSFQFWLEWRKVMFSSLSLMMVHTINYYSMY